MLRFTILGALGALLMITVRVETTQDGGANTSSGGSTAVVQSCQSGQVPSTEYLDITFAELKKQLDAKYPKCRPEVDKLAKCLNISQLCGKKGTVVQSSVVGLKNATYYVECNDAYAYIAYVKRTFCNSENACNTLYETFRLFKANGSRTYYDAVKAGVDSNGQSYAYPIQIGFFDIRDESNALLIGICSKTGTSEYDLVEVLGNYPILCGYRGFYHCLLCTLDYIIAYSYTIFGNLKYFKFLPDYC